DEDAVLMIVDRLFYRIGERVFGVRIELADRADDPAKSVDVDPVALDAVNQVHGRPVCKVGDTEVYSWAIKRALILFSSQVGSRIARANGVISSRRALENLSLQQGRQADC